MSLSLCNTRPTILTRGARVTRAARRLTPPSAVASDPSSKNASASPYVKPPVELKKVTFAEAMGFAGAGPEKINGRLAMVAFVAAFGAEVSTHETVSQQFGDATIPVIGTAMLFAVASLIPIMKGAIDEPMGPFNSKAELVNGRLAMLGLSLMLYIENQSGKAFF